MFSQLSFNLTSDPSGLEPDWSGPPYERLSRSGHRIVSVFLGSIMVFGFLNNLLILVLFCRFRTLRTPVNMLLLNISVSDLLVCACGTTHSLASSVRRRWLYCRLGCMWYGFISSCFGIVSLVSLAVLSYNRYSTLVVYNKRPPDYRKPLLAVGGSWLYSLAWTAPPLLGWSSYGLEGAGTSCSVTWTERSAGSHAYITCLFVFCLGLPVLVMVYCYGCLPHIIRQVGRIRRTSARRREFHILFMVITAVVCYLLCWMPYGIVAMMATFGQPGVISPVGSVVPSILAKSSTVFNPLIYILMNKRFFRCFLILFRCDQLTENEHSFSKTTLVQMNRRACHSNLAHTGPPGTSPRLLTGATTARTSMSDMDGTNADVSNKTDTAEPPETSTRDHLRPPPETSTRDHLLEVFSLSVVDYSRNMLGQHGGLRVMKVLHVDL